MAKFNSKLIIKYSTVFGEEKTMDSSEFQIFNKSIWAKYLRGSTTWPETERITPHTRY